MENDPPKTVDEYLAAVSDDSSRAALERVRQSIKAAAPEAEEVISYKIPLYRYHGHLVGFAAFRNHCALFVTNGMRSKALTRVRLGQRRPKYFHPRVACELLERIGNSRIVAERR